MSCGNAGGGASAKSAGGGGGFQPTETSYMQDLSGQSLTPDQIWDINQQRRQLQEQSKDFLMHNIADERPRLSDVQQWAYDDLERGEEGALKGVRETALRKMQELAKYDLVRAHERVANMSSDVATDAYRERPNGSTAGEDWARAVSDLQKAQRVSDGIKTAIRTRQENRYKRR